ncbi:hypothetical protein NM688_g138 [Phlebia brevispora]|uniref:Uncharacterized protein n=1 Tax=Phlebia brevispora TaxID=194682 RepID=A0ACC1TF22_9APHY|nr:hypothetical protein NM688_g138 [Phlebia brevispora]
MVPQDSTFLGLPSELRLEIYSLYLSSHQAIIHGRQPSNEHIRLLHTSKQIYTEAAPLMCSYISLLYESQIDRFIASARKETLERVRWVDAANDGRLLKTVIGGKEQTVPLSRLHTALSKISSLTHLRVFDCRQGLPISMQSLRQGSKSFTLAFEEAMFPSQLERRLLSYELYVSPATRVQAFKRITPVSLTTLRLSGECQLPAENRMPALRHVTLLSVTGNYFDRHTFSRCFGEADLKSFRYALGDRIAYEIRDDHLRSLCSGPGRNLQVLVLIGCSRLSSGCLAACLESLTQLRYLAISVITVEEQRTNIVLSVPVSVSTFKLHVSNAWYASL